jgi:hypothetical protein
MAVVSRLGIWATGDLCTHTATGLIACYAAAVPFYRHRIVGDLAYTALLFGALAAARVLRATLNVHPAGPAHLNSR